MIVTLALVFAALTPFVLGALLAVGLCICAKRGDEQQARFCEGRLHTRDGAR
jgi:hypothetical protein